MFKKLSCLVVLVLVFVMVVGCDGGVDTPSPGSFTPNPESNWQRRTAVPELERTPARSTVQPSSGPVYETKTKIFSGLTPGENLAEWKEDFPERTVVRFEIGLDSNGKPIELKIWYTK